jgi:putative tryptophan/tyrosine transport system substrate-binding protein
VGRDVTIEYRWAEGRFDRLPAMAAELIRRPVAVILAQAPPAALAAKAATTTVPIVFVVGFDPVASGLVASLNRPGGNATGLTLMSLPVGAKRLEMLRELAPKSSVIAMLVNPLTPDAVPEIRAVHAAAQSMGLQLKIFNASTPEEINTAFAWMSEQRQGALLVGTDPLYVNQREELVALADRLGVPAIYPFREFPAAGGLLSYGTNIANAYRQAGIYTGRSSRATSPPIWQCSSRPSSSW